MAMLIALALIVASFPVYRYGGVLGLVFGVALLVAGFALFFAAPYVQARLDYRLERWISGAKERRGQRGP